jgi:hypothetical protein
VGGVRLAAAPPKPDIQVVERSAVRYVPSAFAAEAVKRIDVLFALEREINGLARRSVCACGTSLGVL